MIHCINRSNFFFFLISILTAMLTWSSAQSKKERIYDLKWGRDVLSLLWFVAQPWL